jgi:hypothetical protein
MRAWIGLLAIGCVGHPITEGGGTPAATDNSGTSETEPTDDPTDDGTTPTDGSDTDTETSGDGSVQQACVDEINRYRATLGLYPYSRWEEGEECADGQAQADSETGVPHSAFGTCGEWAQNECPGWPGPPEDLILGCLQMMWAEGPGEPFSEHGHYINMSSEEYTEVTCGFYQTPDGSWWATQDFR